jgi:Domain of unknown function (DUF4158)
VVGVRARGHSGRAAGGGVPAGGAARPTGRCPLSSYGARAQTRTDHLKLAAARLGWSTAEADGRAGWKRLREFLIERALEHDVPSVLFRLATQWLASDEVRLVRPGVVALMREIASARTEADGVLFRLVEPILIANPALSGELDGLLVVPEEMSVSRMVWLHRGWTTYSPSGIKGELDKVRFLRGMGVDTLDVSVIPEAGAASWLALAAGCGRRPSSDARRTSATRCCWRRSPSATSRCSTRWCRCSTRPCPAWRTAPSARCRRSWRRGRRTT